MEEVDDSLHHSATHKQLWPNIEIDDTMANSPGLLLLY